MTAASRDPATGQVWRTYPTLDAGAVARALERARGVQVEWAARPLRDRARVLERFRRVLFARRHEVADVILRENGKPAVEALTGEVLVALDLARWYARHAERILAAERFVPSNVALWRKRVTIVHEPLGVVGVISPWNYPFMLPAGIVLPALVAGNTVLLKPSELTPGSAVLLGELLAEAGVPEGGVAVLTGDGSTGAALAASAVDKVFFTGSVATGRKVAHACAERMAPCVLELGGSDPAIVLEDADVDVAASGIAWGRFSNAGQTCVAPKRVFVVDAVYERFAARFTAVARALRLGAGGDAGTDVAAMISPVQGAQLAAQLDDAIARGARVSVGGAPPPERPDLFPPTVLENVPADSRVLAEETFGPVVPLVRVRDADEAVRLANASTFGLSASVWGRDRRRAEAVARRLDAGTVVINDTVVAVGIAEVPHGGVKESGQGRSHGAPGLLECVRTKTVVADRLAGARQPWWFGYGPEHARNVDAFVRFWHGGSLAERLGGIWRSVRMLFRHERAL
ncbi:MAG TPA: aldehyde dehydrogenase family protein [Gemmatimonadaceae bacterium]|nr:aldehyde dehydrogenase family protein [Gemmatimonadaceae bacterium]